MNRRTTKPYLGDAEGQHLEGKGGGIQRKERLEQIAVASIVGSLAAGHALAETPEKAMVMEALRRSSNALSEMSESEIGDYLNTLSPEQLGGLISNVKGIYHELLFVEAHNLNAADTTAHLFESTNHPGADVYFTDGSDIVGAIQLKATESVHYVSQHFETYPDIPVAATSEVALLVPDVTDSGFSDASLTTDVTNTLHGAMDPSILDQAGELIGGAIEFVIGGVASLFDW